MKLGSVLSEAARNVVSGTTRAGWVALFFCFVTAGTGVIDAANVTRLVEDGRKFREAGATIFVVSAKGGIDGVACERLTQIHGIVHAGAVRSTEVTLRIAPLPSSPIPVKESSPRFPALLGATVGRQGLLLPEPLFDDLGGARVIETDRGPVQIAASFDFPDDGRRGGLQYAAVAPAPADGLFDECWVDIWPVLPTHVNLARISVSPAAPSDLAVQVSQLNTRLGESFDGNRAFAARSTKWLGLGTALISWCVGFFVVRLRRLELAGNLHSGVPKRSLVLQIFIESTLSTAAGTVCSIALLWGALLFTTPHELEPILGIALRIPLAASISMVAGSTAAVLSLRERYLFRYFRLRN